MVKKTLMSSQWVLKMNELVYDKAAYMDYVREQVDVALGAQP